MNFVQYYYAYAHSNAMATNCRSHLQTSSHVLFQEQLSVISFGSTVPSSSGIHKLLFHLEGTTPPVTPCAAVLPTFRGHVPASYFTRVFLAVRTRIRLSSPDDAESIHILHCSSQDKGGYQNSLSFASHTFNVWRSENLH
jgi:hypothetical protein